MSICICSPALRKQTIEIGYSKWQSCPIGQGATASGSQSIAAGGPWWPWLGKPSPKSPQIGGENHQSGWFMIALPLYVKHHIL